MIERNGTHLKVIMDTLSGLFEQLAEEEKRLQTCLLEKNWQELELIISSMGRISDEIETAETERIECTRELKNVFGLPESASFYETIALLQEPLRTECAASYRNMKCAVLLVKSYAGNINTFVSTATASLREILEELYPHRRGKLYTKSGAPRVTRSDALVLNRHL